MRMRKIVVAIDSFKGCLTSLEAGQAAAEGVRAACPSCEVLVLPVADGGDGMLDVLVSATQGRYVMLDAHDPLMKLRRTAYGISGDGKSAFIEMASISGLALVPDGQRNPMRTTTYGTGELMAHALNHGCRHFIIGLGGSATNDAGLGMLQALGFRFLDKAGHVLGSNAGGDAMCGALLADVSSVDTSFVHPALQEATFTVACDVNNSFFGPDGAAFVYAPQKGADAAMVEELDKAMRQLAEVIHAATGQDISLVPGAGAAGGMGGGLMAFLHAELKPGVRLLLDALHFAKQIEGADVILTGEGKSDRQTLMGKVPWGILGVAAKQQIPVVLLAGSIEQVEELNKAGFRGVFSINPSPLSLKEAMQKETARSNIQRTAEQIVRLLSL